MFKSFVYRILQRRHFWRHATFGQVAELYTARLLRMTGNAMISTFVAIYMYKNGYDLHYIAVYYAVYFTFKIAICWPSAMFVAKYGPKHAMLVANIISIPSLIAFSFLDDIGLWALIIYTLCQGTSMTLYGIAHLTGFSKVKSDANAGKEIGYMNIMDKIAAGISPLIGGAIAWLVSPEVTMWIASGLLLVAAIPLFRTAEPVMQGQKLDFAGFPWGQTWRSVRAEVAIGVDTASIMIVWPLFLATVVFANSASAVYVKIGALSAITIFVGLFASRAYGVMIDRKKGRELLGYSTIAKSAIHLVRPFVATPLAALLTNVLNEMAAAGYSMAFMRGMFDLADRTGHRIVYLMLIEMALNVGGFLICIVMAIVVMFVPDIRVALCIVFGVSAAMVLMIASARFPLYRRSI